MASWKEHRATFWVAVLFVGPFALPLLWRNPNYSQGAKWIISLGVMVLTVYLVWFTADSTIKVIETVAPLIRSGQENMP